jgi:serine/threonine protein kinase
MTITQEDGSKRATCPDCRQTVTIPPTEPGVARRRAVARPEPTRITHKPASHPGAETCPEDRLPVHEEPTRVEDHSLERMDLGFLAPAREPDELGRLGPYRVLGVVGTGGMGIVFRAHDPHLDRVVALKALLPGLAASVTARQRFLREARAAAAIQHDRVVAVYQVGEDRGVPYLAMPFLRGESLDTRLQRETRFEVREALRITAQVAEGLTAIHDLGLIHRDIKPGNLFLEGDSARVKILDFGLARAAGEVQLTREGSIVGSPAFMAPEQAGRQPLDGRADLFGLGCVLYLMLTGTLPFPGDDILTTLLAVTTREPTPPRELVPSLSPAVEALVLGLLAKKAADRPSSARAVLEAIERL